MIKITFEYQTVDEAIVALGKLVGAPAAVAVKGIANEVTRNPVAGSDAPTSKRKGRADKGQPRGPYKVPAAPAESAPAEAPQAAQAPVAADLKAAAPETTGARQPEGVAANAAELVPAPAAAAPVTLEAVQGLFEKVFSDKGIVAAKEVLGRNGVGRLRELKPEQYAQFVEDCKAALQEAA